MTTNNEAFLLYKSFYEPIKYLNNEQLGLLFRVIFEYQNTGQEIELEPQINMAFQFFKNQFRVDNHKYNEIKEKRSESAKKGGNPNFQKGKSNPYYDNVDNVDNLNKIDNLNNLDNHNITKLSQYDNQDNLDNQNITKDNQRLLKITKITKDNLNVNENVNENVNKNVNEKEKNSKKEAFNFSFLELEEEKQFLQKWLDYKKERRESYKTQSSIEQCFTHLINLSNGNIEIAQAIINQSIANNWSGLFPLKNQFSKRQAVNNDEPVF